MNREQSTGQINPVANAVQGYLLADKKSHREFLDLEAWNHSVAVHSLRVAGMALTVAEILKFNASYQRILTLAATLHDLGKIETGPGSDHHPLAGYRRLSAIDAEPQIAQAVLWHHEHWDGSGYPHRLKGREIPLNARIIRLCDSIDTLSSGVSAPPLTEAQCKRRLQDENGREWDPYLIKVLLQNWEEVIGHKG